MIDRRIGVAVALLLVTASAARSQPPGATMSVGVARVDVTPDYAVPLNGYASRPPTGTAQVHQRLYARAVAIGGEKPIVLISVDNLGIPASLRDSVAAALGASHRVDPAAVAVCATHTHAAPWVTGVAPNIFQRDLTPEQIKTVERYTAELTAKLIDAGRAALDARKPATLSFAIGRGAFAMNRRAGGGPSDHDLPVLRALGADGKPVAFVVGYACHCTTLGGVPYMCGDWAGYSSEHLEKMHEGAVALTLIGCGADQNPNRGGGPDVAEQHGKSIADEVARLAGEPARPITAQPTAAFEVVKPPLAPPPTRDQLTARAKADGIAGYIARKNLARLDRGEPLPTFIPVPVQTLSFGDELAMVLLGHEVVVDYSLRIKREFDARRMWVVGYANDERCYLPSERILREGGYEGGDAMVWYDWPAPFAPGVEQIVMDAVHRQVPAAFKPRVSGANAWAPDTVPQIDGTDASKPLSPRAAIASMRVAPTFAVELVAAEPLVADPVAINWGPDGRLWVCEYHDYPDGLDGKLAPGGRVRVLTDTDGDGRYDKSEVFLDRIAFPTGVTVWRSGVIVCAAPEVFYAEDTDGDGKADVKKVLLTGFATHNYQARVNSLEYGLDGWVYGACGLFGGQVTSFNGTKIDLTRRDFRFKPDTGEIESAIGGTQQGRVRNDAGDWFGCHNGSLADHYPLADHWLRRNPHVTPPATTRPIGHGRVFPAAPPLMFAQSGGVGGITAACGIGVYRDTLLGASVYGDAFSCETVHMAVSRIDLAAESGVVTGRRDPAESDREFWSSTDPWHRPVQVRTGPDGALYIVDMYRYLIEHPRFIPDDRKAKLNPRAGDGLGRIWRIVPADGSKRSIVRLDKLAGANLAAAMDSPNGPQRDMVMQLIAWRDDKVAAAALAPIATGSKHAPARAQALAALDLQGGVTEAVMLTATGDADAMVRRQAARLAPRHAAAMPALAPAIAKLAVDDDAQVRLDLAAALAEWDDPKAGDLLGRMLATEKAEYIRAAAMCSVMPQLPRVIAAALEAGADAKLVERLIAVAAAGDDVAALARLIDRVAMPDTAGAYAAPQLAAGVGLLDALARQGKTITSLRSGADPAMTAALDRLAAMMGTARKLVADAGADSALRGASAALLGREADRYDADTALLKGLLAPQQSAAMQGAAVAGLSRIDRPESAAAMLDGWVGYTPELRRLVVDAMLARPAWALVLAQRIKADASIGASLDTARRQRLLNHESEPVRLAAAAALGGAAHASRQQIIDRYAAAITAGDAERGKAVYTQACIACHRYRGEGNHLGPNLDAITDRSVGGLLLAILDPNRGVSDQYVNYIVTTRDGRTISGVIAEESATAITVKDLAAQSHTILRADIAATGSTGRSLMPEGLESAIDAKQMSDLIAYLSMRPATPPKSFAGNEPRTVKPDKDGFVAMPATHGAIYGPSLVFEPDFANLGYWHSADDRVTWTIEMPEARTLDVHLDYACAHDGRKPFVVEGPFAPIEASVPVTANGRWDTYRTVRLGRVKLPAGRSTLTIRSAGALDGALMDLRRVVLTPPDKSPPGAAVVAKPPAPPAGPPKDAADRIADLTRGMGLDRKSQYERIPAIFREAITAGKRNDAKELLRVIEVSTPKPDAPLRDWEAVAIGGGGDQRADAGRRLAARAHRGTAQGRRRAAGALRAIARRVGDDGRRRAGSARHALRCAADDPAVGVGHLPPAA